MGGEGRVVQNQTGRGRHVVSLPRTTPSSSQIPSPLTLTSKPQTPWCSSTSTLHLSFLLYPTQTFLFFLLQRINLNQRFISINLIRIPRLPTMTGQICSKQRLRLHIILPIICTRVINTMGRRWLCILERVVRVQRRASYRKGDAHYVNYGEDLSS